MITQSRIHVGHVLHRFAIGGLENGIVNLINRLDHETYRHSIVCVDDYDPKYIARLARDDIGLYTLGKRQGNDPRVWWRAFKLFRELQLDIVHTRNLAALELQLMALAAGVPHRIHGEHGWDMQDLDGSNRKYRIARRGVNIIVHQFVALSCDIERYLTNDVGVSAQRVHRICNGVDDEHFHPGAARRPGSPLTIGWVGRMKTVKNPLGLCRAFIALLARRPDLHGRVCLRMLGDGPLRHESLELAAQSGCADVVDCPGDSDSVAEEMRRMDLLVLSSRAEGISNTILEAMATGLPVIATAVGGNAELVADGLTGTLVAPNDEDALAAALERYLDDEALRTAHGAAGRARVENEFSIQRMVDAYDNLYRRFISQ